MRLTSTAGSGFGTSRPTAPTRKQAGYIWNWNSESVNNGYHVERLTLNRGGVMKSFLLFAVLAMAVSSFAAESKEITYKSGDESVKGMLYTPKGNGPFPAIIVIHEWWGLNDWVKEQAAKLADEGYVALAVDLYRGKVASNPDEAHQLMRGVPEDRSQRDLKAAFDYLASQKNVKADRIGSIGWCMGGGYSLDVALLEPKLAATVINYGHLATEP